jgi:histone deacetylase complex regulatory component SIN3
MKSQELFELLKRDRTFERSTNSRQIAYRMQAESVIGPDENIYKVEHVSDTMKKKPGLTDEVNIAAHDRVTCGSALG